MPKTVQIYKPKTDVIVNWDGIILYDKDNMYPNTMLNILERSATAQAVLNVKKRFLFGKGMTEAGEFWKKTINARGHRVDQLVRRIIESYVNHGGFALHFNYNAMFEKTSVTVFPFEHCRLGKPDDVDFSGHVIVYDRWKEYKKSAATTYNLYNPDPDVISAQVAHAGGWEKFRGQVLYYGENGETVYPISPFESCKEEMITELLLGTGKNSNASTNFMASQIFVYNGSFAATSPYPEDREKAEKGEQTRLEAELLAMLSNMQGAQKIGAVALMENNIKDVNGDPVKMDVLKFDVQNFDKIFEHTEKSCENIIIKVSGVPHILVIPTATGFSQELLENYYQFYNEVIAYDRQIIEETCMEIFRNWHYDINPAKNYSITPLTISIAKETQNVAN